MSPPIFPHLWFATEAKEAAKFYVEVFPNSKIVYETTLKDTPGGDCNIVDFEINGHQFMAISAGDMFKINPSISFIVTFDPVTDKNALENLDRIWGKLAEGGKPLMDIGEYPFSKRYGWIQDKFGVSWQLIYGWEDRKEEDVRPYIMPSLLFAKESSGKAEEASEFWMSVFKDSKRGMTARYGKESKDMEGQIMFSDFRLGKDQWFAVCDGGNMHDFQFNEAVSLVIDCEDQAEIDYYCDKLSAVPEAEVCGWLKDKYGVSWQVEPKIMHKMICDSDEERLKRVQDAFMQMKRFNLQELMDAYDGKSPKKMKQSTE